MDTHRLRYFLAVADTLHFGRAAQSLHISQPALSHQIMLLERELGVRLLTRTTRNVRLTKIGNSVAAQARLLGDTQKLVERRIDDFTTGRSGTLRVGFVPSAAFGLLPRIVQHFSRGHPGVHLSLQESTSEDQILLVANGQLDLGLVRDIDQASNALVVPLAFEEFLLACPQTHWSRDYETLSLHAVAGERFIVMPHSVAPAMTGVVSTLCQRAGIDLTDALEAIAFPTTLGLVASGMGLAIVPETVSAIHLPGLVYRKIDDPDARSRMCAVVSQGNIDPVTEAFLHDALSVAAQS